MHTPEHTADTTAHTPEGLSRKSFIRSLGGIIAAGGMATLTRFDRARAAVTEAAQPDAISAGVSAASFVAHPFNMPGPVTYHEPRHHKVHLVTKEFVAEIEPGVRFRYMSFGGQVPGPMIRVRQGDTVELTITNDKANHMVHNIDLHAVYATGGGAEDTLVVPGQSRTIRFKTLYPGAFIYHCAVPNLDFHISSGMFGMIVVEPPQGLPPVDREIYLGQNEVYTDKPAGKQGFHNFSFDNMTAENPTYVLLNGMKHGLTADGIGEIEVNQGEKVRVFFVCGGPNLTSHFHPIGNVFTKAWPAGALANRPMNYVQTLPVPPGSCGVFELETPVAQKIKLVDHSLSRVARKGMLGIIHVKGKNNPSIYKPLSS